MTGLTITEHRYLIGLSFGNLPDKGWRWKPHGAPEIAPRDMETWHLFYTLRMVWNHTMPAHMSVGQRIRYYHFGPHYTKHFMKDAVLHIGSELARRTDMEPEWEKELAEMAEWMQRRVLIEPTRLCVRKVLV